MTELATMARPYATAVFKLAKAKAAAAKWSGQLAFMATVIANKEMAAMVNNPKVNKDKLTGLLLEICQSQIDNEGRNFLKTLLQNNRLKLLPEIAKQFEELKAEDEGYVDVEVLTAFPFAKEAEKKFAVNLEKTLSKKVRMNVAVDNSLIGGVLVRAGDRVIDGSIKGQLQNLRKALQ